MPGAKKLISPVIPITRCDVYCEIKLAQSSDGRIVGMAHRHAKKGPSVGEGVCGTSATEKRDVASRL